MSAVSMRSLSQLAQITHWLSCLLGAAVVLLFTVFAIGGGLPPLAALNWSFVALGTILLGFVLIWWKDWLGGLVSLLGLAWFQAIEFGVNGHVAGEIFWWCVIPGVIALVAGLFRWLSSRAAT